MRNISWHSAFDGGYKEDDREEHDDPCLIGDRCSENPGEWLIANNGDGEQCQKAAADWIDGAPEIDHADENHQHFYAHVCQWSRSWQDIAESHKGDADDPVQDDWKLFGFFHESHTP